MIAKVLPLVRLPRSRDVFDYIVPDALADKLQTGHMVMVPFRSRHVLGLVTGIAASTRIPRAKLKRITKVVRQDPLLSTNQLKLARYVSRTYRTSEAVTVRALLPRVPARVLQHGHNAEVDTKKRKKATLSNGQNVVSLLQSKVPTVHWFESMQDKESTLTKLVHYFAERKMYALILSPRIETLEKITSHLPKDIIQQCAVVTSKTFAAASHYSMYEQILRGKTRLVIGTRSSLFAPIKKLDIIVIDDEEAREYKQEEPNPRYDARTVAGELARRAGARLISLSVCPRVETMARMKIVRHPTRRQDPKSTLIDMRDQPRSQISYAISHVLEESILSTIKKKQTVFLYLNRRGEYPIVQCRDCGLIIVCPSCALPLVAHEGKKFLLCHHCGHQESPPPFCPKCQGADIRFGGHGVQALAHEIQQAFPQLRVVRLDKDTVFSHNQNIAGADVLVGTSAGVVRSRVASVSLVGVISADTGLHVPDFRSSERTFQNLVRLKSSFPQAAFMVQTFYSDHPAIYSVVSRRLKSFYDHEIDSRSAFGYPPATLLVKLIGQHTDENQAQRVALQLCGKLRTHLKDSPIRLMGPLIPYRPVVRGRVRRHIILKVPLQSRAMDSLHLSPHIARVLQGALRLVPDDWIIDIEPQDLL